jgi:vacuolar-type H+-ATPase subunit H
MENIIKELIQIEEEADELVNAVSDERKNLKARISEKAEAINAEINQRTLEEINKMYERGHDESSKKIAEINARSQHWFSSLEKSYQLNRDAWEAEIVKKIIG